MYHAKDYMVKGAVLPASVKPVICKIQTPVAVMNSNKTSQNGNKPRSYKCSNDNDGL
jgi:hypothetical protein